MVLKLTSASSIGLCAVSLGVSTMAGSSWLLTFALVLTNPAARTPMIGLSGLKPESEGILLTILGFLYLAYLYGKKLHENQKKLKEFVEAKEKDKKSLQLEADKKIEDAKSQFQETLERVNNALKEENVQLRERMVKQETTGSLFKEQYDKTIVLLQEKNEKIQELSVELGSLKEENAQLKRRLHGKERRQNPNQHDQ